MPLASLIMAAAVAAGSASSPPPVPRRLVDVTTLAPGIRVEMRYASADNFLKRAVYPCARCLLDAEAAAALARVETSLEAQGLHLKVWDCYRPRAVQQEMWKLVPDARFVADPRKGSNHERAGAVDITLTDADGHDLEMPTAHDDFTEKARADAPASAAATSHRATLRTAMEAEGFAVVRSEWWHFDAKGSRTWPRVDADLCAASVKAP